MSARRRCSDRARAASSCSTSPPARTRHRRARFPACSATSRMRAGAPASSCSPMSPTRHSRSERHRRSCDRSCATSAGPRSRPNRSPARTAASRARRRSRGARHRGRARSGREPGSRPDSRAPAGWFSRSRRGEATSCSSATSTTRCSTSPPSSRRCGATSATGSTSASWRSARPSRTAGFFVSRVGKSAFVERAAFADGLTGQSGRPLAGGMPWALIGLISLLALALAANELLCGRLEWRTA